MSSKRNAPIGVFDSGIGGLTVAKAVMETLPGEDIIYFGDTARVPYGIKSVETIRTYALEITQFLIKKKVKMILIACNTVSAAAEEQVIELATKHKIPVLGVVKAGAQAANELTINHNRVGVIGTLATIGSGTYEKALHELDPGMDVYSKACPLLVPLAEEGWVDNDIAKDTLEIYLEDFKAKKLNALILGCTHYPLFKPLIREVMDGQNVEIVDSAVSIARMASRKLTELDLLNDQKDGQFECYVSDKPQRFQQLAELFLGRRMKKVEIVSMH